MGAEGAEMNVTDPPPRGNGKAPPVDIEYVLHQLKDVQDRIEHRIDRHELEEQSTWARNAVRQQEASEALERLADRVDDWRKSLDERLDGVEQAVIRLATADKKGGLIGGGIIATVISTAGVIAAAYLSGG